MSQSLAAIGINHKSAPVDVRERLAFAPEQLGIALDQLVALPGVEEAAILSTCNRTELYCNLHSTGRAEEIVQWLATYHQLAGQDLAPYLYQHRDQHAVRHTLQVACGLDSLVLGETQILGQLKSAYHSADEAGTLGSKLNRLFQHAFSVAKQIRHDTAIGDSPVSVAFAAVSLAKQIFADLSNQTALMIGAGETIELAARHLAGNDIGQLIVANRSIGRAEALAQRFDAEAVTLSELGDALPRADIIIASTASALPVLGKGAVESALKQRKHKPMFMVDIAVPRDIEPEVGDLADVYLYSIDDLDQVIEANLQTRRNAAKQADEIIIGQVEDFMGWLRGQDAAGTIQEFRRRATATQQDVLARAQGMIKQGKSPEQALMFLAHTLTNKLIHAPTNALNRASRDGDAETVKAARTILGLPEETDK